MSDRAAYRIDGRQVDAARFYATACDPSRSVVVEACAGAGKTWMLVSRILRALLAGAQPQQILAITFTRKAAGEMRERLSDWLREFSKAGDEQRRLALQQRGVADDDLGAMSEALASLHERLLLGGRGVEIRTFHGWFSQLLQAAPLELLQELKLAPGVDLVEDPQELEPELFRRFHARVGADSALRADYFAAVAQRGRSPLRKWLLAAWQRRVEVEAADAGGTLEGSVESPSALWPAFAGLQHPAQRLHSAPERAQLLELSRSLGAAPGAVARKQATALEQALAIEDPARAYEAARMALLTQGGAPRKGLDDPRLPAALALLEEIGDAIEQQRAHEEHGRMVRLARALLADYEALKRERGLADMADLERCALHLLGDATLAGWVQQRLDQRLRHVLIDEFQDTSPLQWQALHGWLSGYAGAGGGAARPSVFIVGDPKQSIYRFRGAEPRVFVAAREFVAGALDGAVLECDHTRRNAPAVLQVVNAVFEQAQAAQAFEGFRTHTTGAASVEHAGVGWLPRITRPPRKVMAQAEQVWRDSLTTPRREAEQGLRQQEAEQVARAVQALTASGIAPGDILVLARKRVALREAALALQAHGIDHVAPEQNALLDAPEVRDLVALLDALASPAHDLSLAHALRSPLFGASDEDLLWLSARAARGRWWSTLARMAQAASPALQRAASLLAGWRSLLQRLPPHDLLDRIVDEGALMPRLLAALPAARRPAAQQAVRALLALSLQLEGARYASVYGFVRALKRRALKMPAWARPDAVQLLTVHGAKGLEARAVILIDSDAPPARAESATLLVDWPVERSAPLRCAFVASEARCPPSLRALLERERAARAREELNGLYVAMTRAREQLLLSAIEPHQHAHEGSWWTRIVRHAAPWSGSLRTAPQDGAQQPIVHLELPMACSFPAGTDTASGAPAPRSEQARMGEALHRVLEWSTAGHRPALEPLVSAAAAAFEVSDTATLLRHARTVLEAPLLQPFFDPARLAWAGNEVSFVDGGEVLRVDRLVALKTEPGRAVWWVLDYKLQQAPHAVPAYRAQLERYRTLVQSLQPAEQVRAAFITANGELVEL